MTTKSRLHGLNGMHTAGIFSDMTVDGPEIGTLVVIVDRAKNLPNRKTIGKQDPYCAARLGKEAKKTETDRRGGQTPRWDQELRYTVHDSPDYYQLKVSVFNDDKKTDLIGETWVDLKEVVVPGGGQNDLWHNLSCKGKYAGEIRIEITYYDTRPKQEKPSKSKEPVANGVEEGSRDSLKGPRQAKAGVKRRPLPSDPVTGEPAPAPAPAPVPAAIPDHVQTPPRGYPPAPTAVPEHSQTPPRGYPQPSAIPDHVQTPPRGYQGSPNGIPEHVHTPSRGYSTPPTAFPEHVHTPQRARQSVSYIPNQSPLQNVEYNTPPPRFGHSQGYESPGGYGPPGSIAFTPTAHQMSGDRYEIYDPMPGNDYNQDNGMDHYEEEEHHDPRDQYIPHDNHYDIPPSDDFGPPPSPGGLPPPPPAHRSRNGSSHVSPAPAPIMPHHNSYGPPSDSRPTNIYNTPPAHDAHRHSMPTYPQRQQYQAYSPERDQEQFQSSDIGQLRQSPPRNYSHDAQYNSDYVSMQPTVEDAPPSPGGSYSGLRRNSQYVDPRYEKVPSPAPLNLSGRESSSSGRNSISMAPSHQYSSSSIDYASTNSQLSFREHSATVESVPSRASYNSAPRPLQKPRSHSANEMADNYGLPEIPSTMVAGIDPIIAQEISDRIYDEKRGSFGQSNGNSSRGRYQNSSQYQQNQPSPRSYHDTAGAPFIPAASSYDERQSRFSTATVPVVKPRAISPDLRSSNRGTSPNPRSATTRKSVSPSPRPSEDTRRLSGIPFGPDSYNALNPTISNSPSTTSLSAAYDTNAIDPDAKIITHDGREVDPSDHIPESNYAPLLESKGPKYASQQPDRNYRPPPNNTQTLSATGRRPLRQAGRPQSMAASSPIYMNSSSYDTSIPPAARNRLQKKSNRMSAQATPNSSPLVPISPYNDNGFTSKSLVRASTMDYNSSENYAPQYGSSPGYRGSGPPIPAKVPMGMNGPPPPHDGGDPWALLEEMKNIDLGSGRARRRGY